MQSSLLAVRWQPRQVPLTPVAVAACGAAALRLAQKLLTQDESLARFEGVAGAQLIVLQIGAAENANTRNDSAQNDTAIYPGIDLPWVDGAQYLGSHPAAPSLLLPTNYEPALPGEILEKVFQARGTHGEKLAVLLQSLLLVPMTQARPVSRAALSVWLAGQAS